MKKNHEKTLEEYGEDCLYTPVIAKREISETIVPGCFGVIQKVEKASPSLFRYIVVFQCPGQRGDAQVICELEDIRLLTPDELLFKVARMQAGQYMENGELTLIRECSRRITPLLLWRLLDIAHDNGMIEAAGQISSWAQNIYETSHCRIQTNTLYSTTPDIRKRNDESCDTNP